MMPCLCTTCLNHIEHIVEEVQFYLFKYGIDLSYTKWDKHGEKDEQATTAQIHVNAITEFLDDTDFDLDFGSEIPTYGPATIEMVNATKESFDKDDLAKFQELLLDAEKPLYKGCPDFTKLSAIDYKKIHVCSNNCILYWKDNKELTVCPTCGISRWKVDNKTHKVYKNISAKSWRTIDEKFSEIAKDLRNLRLGISADGVDVKSGTKALVDDLHTLFETGVDTYDASTKENFNLRAVVLWTINDYLVLGTLCGCPYSGFKGCVKEKEWRLMDNKNLACSKIIGRGTNITTRKETSLQELDKLQLELVVTLCLLEKFFPSSFFDIMIHLTVNLTREVERELAISKDSVSETVRWISYGPRATIVKYEAYNINGYTFRTKSNDDIVYQNSRVSVEAVDLHISKEVVTTRKSFYYRVLQEIWVLDYRFRKIPLFKYDWVNHKAGGVKYDPNLSYTLVDLNSLGHKDDPFILASQARQVFYVKDQIDKKLSIAFKKPTYKELQRYI
ncbi:putative reverse transcriptase domain-containing protein [Tanacetum coccineum]